MVWCDMVVANLMGFLWQFLPGVSQGVKPSGPSYLPYHGVTL